MQSLAADGLWCSGTIPGRIGRDRRAPSWWIVAAPVGALGRWCERSCGGGRPIGSSCAATLSRELSWKAGRAQALPRHAACDWACLLLFLVGCGSRIVFWRAFGVATPSRNALAHFMNIVANATHPCSCAILRGYIPQAMVPQSLVRRDMHGALVAIRPQGNAGVQARRCLSWIFVLQLTWKGQLVQEVGRFGLVA